jgi:hypothetical protein
MKSILTVFFYITRDVHTYLFHKDKLQTNITAFAGNKHADALAKKGAKITQTHIRETSYLSIKRHLKQVFQSVYRHELETKVSQKPWKQEIAKIPDWPRR